MIKTVRVLKNLVYIFNEILKYKKAKIDICLCSFKKSCFPSFFGVVENSLVHESIYYDSGSLVFVSYIKKLVIKSMSTFTHKTPQHVNKPHNHQTETKNQKQKLSKPDLLIMERVLL